MEMMSYTIKIQNEKFGTLLNENFVNPSQFKLFLKMVQGCITMKEDLTFFNGVDFLIHIPYSYLVGSIINTTVGSYSLTDHLITKSKMEAFETK